MQPVQIDQRVGQDLAKPGQPLCVGLAPKLTALPMGLQERFLDHVRSIQLAAEQPADLRTGKHPKILAIAFYRPITFRL
jgi:hypothetical protein